jgi:D-alanine-D-alanine ligase
MNANPSISPDSGFVAAAKEAGYNCTDVIKRIIYDLNY